MTGITDQFEVDADQSTTVGSSISGQYLDYALSLIAARALPDVRDGLKHVHRHLLFAMHQLQREIAGDYQKSARIVGEVMGKYYPHGDQSIYAAMTRLAQPFALRYPLVEGLGNFGDINGGNPAPMRYTEARLSAAGCDLMAGLNEDAVDFRPTYNGEHDEPAVLPGFFPNLLANGAMGLAVGMATSIPPHNAAELIDAAIHLIDAPQASVAELLAYIKGPDFPTGGALVSGGAVIRDAYISGHGAFTLRGRVTHQGSPASGNWTLVVTQLPYGVSKAKFIEQIAALVAEDKLPLDPAISDEDDEDIRIILRPLDQRSNADTLTESLFRLTDLEVRIPLHLRVRDASGDPQIMSLRDVLAAYVHHLYEVVRRRTRYRADNAAERLRLINAHLELLSGRITKIVHEQRRLPTGFVVEVDDGQRGILTNANISIGDFQTLGEEELKRERDQLEEQWLDLLDLLGSDARIRGELKRELAALRVRYGPDTVLGKRRTLIAELSFADGEQTDRAAPTTSPPPSLTPASSIDDLAETIARVDDEWDALLGDTLRAYQIERLGSPLAHLEHVRATVTDALAYPHD